MYEPTGATVIIRERKGREKAKHYAKILRLRRLLRIGRAKSTITLNTIDDL